MQKDYKNCILKQKIASPMGFQRGSFDLFRKKSLVIQLLCLVFGLTGEVDAQLTEGSLIDTGKDDRGVRLTAHELRELTHGKLSRGICRRAY